MNNKNAVQIKKAVFTILLIAFYAGGACAQGSQIVLNTLADDGREVPMKHDTVTSITSFSGRCINDTTYLKWTTKDMRSKGIFIIYRSSDGINFSMVATKNVFAAPIKSDIANYYRDASGGTKYYRLAYINANSEYIVSEKIYVISDNESAAGRSGCTRNK